MSTYTISNKERSLLREAVRGQIDEIVKRSGKSKSTVNAAINGYYYRGGERIPYHNDMVIQTALDVAEEVKQKMMETKQRITQLS